MATRIEGLAQADGPSRASSPHTVASKTLEPLERKWIILPVSVLGCGQAPVARALESMFGFPRAHSIRNAYRNAEGRTILPDDFRDMVVPMLEKNATVIMDRPNHRAEERQAVRDLCSQLEGNVNVLAIAWDFSDLTTAKVANICWSRLRAGVSGEDLQGDLSFASVLRMVREYEAPGADEVDARIELRLDEDLTATLRRVTIGVVEALRIRTPRLSIHAPPAVPRTAIPQSRTQSTLPHVSSSRWDALKAQRAISRPVAVPWLSLRQYTSPLFYVSAKITGCLIMLSALSPESLLITTKYSFGDGSHVAAGERWLDTQLERLDRTRRQLAEYLWYHDWTLMCELCDEMLEQYVFPIPYEQLGLNLHGINKCATSFETEDPDVVEKCAREWGFNPVYCVAADSHTSLDDIVVGSEMHGNRRYDFGSEEPRRPIATVFEQQEFRVYPAWMKRQLQENPGQFRGHWEIIQSLEKFTQWTSSEDGMAALAAGMESDMILDPLPPRYKFEFCSSGKWLILLTGLPGCGKSTVSFALSRIFQWKHLEIRREKFRSPKQARSSFMELVEDALKCRWVVIADGQVIRFVYPDHILIMRRRAFHRAISRERLIGKSEGSKARIIALQWVTNASITRDAVKICIDRLAQRSSEAAGQDEHDRSLKRWLAEYDPIRIDEVDAVLPMVYNEDLGATISRAVSGLARLLSLQEPPPHVIADTVNLLRADDQEMAALDMNGRPSKAASAMVVNARQNHTT
ncbi:hypothetical protein AURDEDRAFT_171860 [Auricularia subglabra TFB-10046 SS5]|uniref:tRNA ligase kinase domain-containing protein n=1 Tax=Auricularia subglabra (strain TFB-10046 / SS5) TaxID=717982 RepID=J0DBU0_AURST|nr:hypothetical protein AURDEDRAFT_171860 [Auricularia subglabra TFB-10046 SS5]